MTDRTDRTDTSTSCARDKPLFTPGPLTTSQTVKLAMLRDLGSRDFEFIETVRRVRRELLDIAGVSQDEGYEAVLMQGSGTFGIEAIIASTAPPEGKLLVVINGAYGDRIAKIASILNVDTAILRCTESETPDPTAVGAMLDEDPAITSVAVVHCETTTGIINPIEAIGRVVRERGKVYFVDSMSAFGAVPFDFKACEIDYLVSSANKCIEGVPGFSFAICRRARLEETEGWARSLSFDLLAQWRGLESSGQFRFTPPTHVILAFDQAITELREEGGVAGRAARYRENYETILEGFQMLGFEAYLPEDRRGYIITSFRYPEHPKFDFEDFYARLNDKSYVIYPGKVSDASCFRIGHIGRLFASDMKALIAAVAETLREMQVSLS